MLVFSNISSKRANLFKSTTKIPLTKDLGKYLGTLMLHGRITRAIYLELINKVKQRLERWNNKHLSMASWISLVQSVTSTMASYLMQMSYLPEHVVQEIDRLNKNFILGHVGGIKKNHALS